jgi:hypothetical protein
MAKAAFPFPTGSRSIVSMNYGLYLDRTALSVPLQAVQDGYNFRIKNGVIGNLNLGWTLFSSNFVLNGPVVFIDDFSPRNGGEQLIFGTPTDIYRYVSLTDTVVFITPRYEVGTASSSVNTVTGVGTTWSTNVRAGDQISFGAIGVNDPNATWYTITVVGGNTTLTAPGVGTHGSGAYTIRKLFAGNLNSTWSFDVFVNDAVSGDDQWIATNGQDPVISWNGIASQVTLQTGFNFTCEAITVFDNMVTYHNLIQSGVELPTSMINSDVSKPLVVVGGLASQFRVHDGTDEILNAVPLGDNLVIYSEQHVVLAQFVGAPLVFIFREAIGGYGPLGHNAIADFGDTHEYASTNAQYEFDGVSIKEIGWQVWREITRTADPMRRRHVYAHFDEENAELLWSVPATTDPDAGDVEAPPVTAWMEHYLEAVPQGVPTPFARRYFPFTSTGFYEKKTQLTWAQATFAWSTANYAWNDQFNALGFPLNLAGDVNGKIYTLNTSQYTDTGALLPSFVRTGRVPLVDGRQRALLKRIYPFAVKLNLTLNIKIWVTDHAAGPVTNAGTYTFDTSLPEGKYFVSPYRRGRYAEMELNTTGTAWQVWGYDSDVLDGGPR